MDKLALNSYAKLNLYLEVLNKRADSYHNIRTIFERISLCDKIILKLRKDKRIRLISASEDLPQDETRNFAYQSAKILQESLGVDKGVDIRLIKHIPVGSGLGGGSSNAATVLMGLNKLWGLKLKRDKLLKLAKRIGCDVPFFLYDTPFALGEARGDKIKPLKTLKRLRLQHVLVVPKLSVSTPVIYKMWDKEAKKVWLTTPKDSVKILSLGLSKNSLILIGKALFNSLEKITSRRYAEVRRIREKLEELKVKAALMSGSGPAVFGLVSSRKEALSLYRQLKAAHKSWRVFISGTY